MESGECSIMMNLIVVYRSYNIVRVIKSRRLRWAGRVSEWKKVGVLSNFSLINLQEGEL